MLEQITVGIDVSKDRLDVHVRPPPKPSPSPVTAPASPVSAIA